MHKAAYLLLILWFLTSTNLVAEDDCSTELFPDQAVSRLFWNQEGESFIVGLGDPSANEFTYEYQRVSYGNGEIEVTDYSLIDPLWVTDLVSDLGILGQFYSEYDQTHLFLSPNHQTAVYFQENYLNVVDLEGQTSNRMRLEAPVGEVKQQIWLSETTFLIVTTPPYGIGSEILKVNLDHNTVSYLADFNEILIGAPSISADKHYVIASNPSEPQSLTWINLSQAGIGTAKSIQVPFNVQIDLSPIWSSDGQEVYLVGSEMTVSDVINSIYQLTFKGDFVETTQLVELDDDLAYSTSLWLIDPVNRLSIHALRYGGLNIVCWDEASV